MVGWWQVVAIKGHCCTTITLVLIPDFFPKFKPQEIKPELNFICFHTSLTSQTVAYNYSTKRNMWNARNKMPRSAVEKCAVSAPEAAPISSKLTEQFARKDLNRKTTASICRRNYCWSGSVVSAPVSVHQLWTLQFSPFDQWEFQSAVWSVAGRMHSKR